MTDRGLKNKTDDNDRVWLWNANLAWVGRGHRKGSGNGIKVFIVKV